MITSANRLRQVCGHARSWQRAALRDNLTLEAAWPKTPAKGCATTGDACTLALLWFQLQGVFPFTQSGFGDFLTGRKHPNCSYAPALFSLTIASSRLSALLTFFAVVLNPTSPEITQNTVRIQISRSGHCRSTMAGTLRRQHSQLLEGETPLCCLPGALLSEQAKVLLFLPRSAKLLFCLQVQSTDRCRKGLSRVGSLAATSLGSRRGEMRAEKRPAQAGKEKTLKLPETILCTALPASNAADAQEFPGDGRDKSKVIKFLRKVPAHASDIVTHFYHMPFLFYFFPNARTF